jgi:alginate O-acetyltransferase complex protein AlgI
MLFNSPSFLFLFLPVLLLLYSITPWILRNVLLLIASLIFYAWGEGTYVIILIASIFFNYLIGVSIESTSIKYRKRISLLAGVGVNVIALLFFKYTGFIIQNVNLVLNAADISPLHFGHVHLPIGISFFVFQGVSYVVDVYRGATHAQSDLTKVALFKAFFPQLIAGPIVRYVDIRDQLSHRKVDSHKIVEGIERFAIGLVKKTLIANQCASIADPIFDAPAGSMSPIFLWMGALAYALQLYFDFSAYSDMAIGLAKLFGFDFLENFNYPYIARSVQDFWRRWHISLSTWFRDYVYIPLGGNRLGSKRTYFNLFIVFFLTGLWHGASWNFICWGLFHGSFLALERMGGARVLQRCGSIVGHAYTMLVVLIGWVLFRSPDLTAAGHYLSGMFGQAVGDSVIEAHFLFYHAGLDTVLMLIAAVLFSTPFYPWLMGRLMNPAQSGLMHPFVRVAWYSLLIAAVLVSSSYIAAGTYNPFIYFRF